MANTTFNGPVRSENGFQTISINSTTGAVTTTSTIGPATSVTSLAVSGASTLSGAIIGGVQALSGAGAVNLTTLTTRLTTTGANALTLANGTDGQIKIIVMVVDGGDGTLTPTTKTGYTTITFNDVGDSVVLQYFTTLGWMVVSNYGTTIA